MQLSLRNVVVTGAASGIGAATAALLAEEGATVHAWDINEVVLDATVSRLRAAGHDVRGRVVDVRSETDVAAAFDGVAQDGAVLDGVVNVAGLQRAGRIDEMSPIDWDAQIAVNLTGTWLVDRHAVRVMKPQRHGAVVNVASVGGIRGVGAGMTGYSASKGGVVSLTMSLAAEVAAHGLRVNCICPGWVDTPFNDPVIAAMGGPEAVARQVEATVPMKRQGTPEEIATAICFLLTPRCGYMTGHALVVDGGLVVAI
jgi:dihydroanticapsin dehydrogenase